MHPSRKERRLSREMLLAAEIFAYSYQNYHDHLGIGNQRFERYMPDDAKATESAIKEGWPVAKLAKKIDLPMEAAQRFLDRFPEAAEIVDADSPAAALRHSLRQSFDAVLGEQKIPDHEIENFITQACYRVSDFLYMMESENADRSRFREISEKLRDEGDDLMSDG